MQALRGAIAAATTFAPHEIVLPEGSRYQLLASLCIHATRVTLRSEGTGAVIDGMGATRIFDVAHGGQLTLDRVHLTRGGDVKYGGALQVRGGSRVSVLRANISDSAVDSGGSGGAIEEAD